MKPIVLFDFDRTLFDTAHYGDALTEVLAELLRTNKVTLRKVMTDYVSSLASDLEFDPDNYTKFLCDKFSFENQEILLSVFYGEGYKHWYKDYIFPEAYELINNLKNKYNLGLYSEGTQKFQNYKIESSGILKYFDIDLIFILDNKSTPVSLAKIPSSSVIIDDKKSVCQYLFENGMKCFWLNKKGEPDSKDFPTVHTLLEVMEKLL